MARKQPKRSGSDRPAAPAGPAPVQPASPWILDRWRDLVLFVATPFLIVPLFFLARRQWSVQDLALFVAAFGALGHHFPGMLRAYGDRALFRRFPGTGGADPEGAMKAGVGLAAVLPALLAVLACGQALAGEAAAEEPVGPPAEPPRLTLTPPGEPGEPLVVTGVVRDPAGEPVPGARLHVFQADARGYYTPERPMDEPNARLAGRLTTGDDGRFELHTIRPGHYPGKVELAGELRRIPAHVHFHVEAPGFRKRRLQLVFADDPEMAKPYWRRWSKRDDNPVVELERDGDGVYRCRLEIILQRSPG